MITSQIRAHEPSYGVYVHLPWCRVRCPYCAFNVYPVRDALWPAYVDALLLHWQQEAPHFRDAPSSLFFGGGTPSLIPGALLARLVAGLSARADAELTLEANPEDLVGEDGESRLASWLDAGINRLSLGVQTFDARVGRRLGRTRTAEAGRSALARSRGVQKRSVDLIFGAPEQTWEALREDIEIAASEVDHISLYGLTLEEGTPFGRRPELRVDDDRWAELYEGALERLDHHGFERYEVSNFARPGHRCQHNEHYWRARPWAGIGAGAHGWRPSGERTVAIAEPVAYIDAVHRSLPLIEAAVPEPDARLHDLLWTTLRHVEGTPIRWLEAATGHKLIVPAALTAGGLLSTADGSLRLGRHAFLLADGITDRIHAASIGSSGR